MRARVAATAIAAVALIGAWFLARDPTPYDPGLAVIPIEARDESWETEELARGLTAELTAQVTRVAGLRERRWVLPLSLATGAKAEGAATRFGVQDVITGGIRVEGNEIIIDLEHRDASSLKVRQRDSWSLSPDTRASPDFVPWLASVLAFDLTDAELQRVRAPDPTTLEVWRHYISGLGLITTRTDSARTLLRTAAHADSNFAPARLAYARAMWATYQADRDDAWTERIESELSQLHGDELLRAEAYRIRAEVESMRGNAKAAAQFYRVAMLHAPANPDHRRSLWFEWLGQGANATAEAICVEGIEVHPGYIGSHHDLAYVYVMADRYAEAAAELETVIRLAPTYEQPYNTLGAVYYALERWDEAIEMFEESYDLKRENPSAISNLGTLYYMEGRFEDAAGMFELAAAYFDSIHTVYGNLASALRWVPDRRQDYERALSRATDLAELKLAKDPEDAELLSFLAGYYAAVDSVHALRLARRAADLAPDDPEVIYRVAVAHEEAGERTQALAFLGTAIELGCMMREVEAEPLLEELRQDSRYAYLTP
jgi:Flp pilus assembly protein TadD/TolB-like protein